MTKKVIALFIAVIMLGSFAVFTLSANIAEARAPYDPGESFDSCGGGTIYYSNGRWIASGSCFT